jgi:hypothetical protein
LQTERWNVTTPGFTEIDLVSHSGDCADGEFLHSLNVTDIHTTWVETQAVLGKGQERVRQALDAIAGTLPFPLRGKMSSRCCRNTVRRAIGRGRSGRCRS